MNEIPKEIVGINFTFVEREIVKVLSTGGAKTLSQLAVWDAQIDDNCVKVHIHNARKRMNSSSYRIWSGYEEGKLVYRLVRILV